MWLTALIVVVCCAIASVTSNRDDFNELVSSYSPQVVQDVRYMSDTPVFTEDGYFLNEFLQPPTSDQLTSAFPMPYDIQSLLERSASLSLRIMNESWDGLSSTDVFFKGEQLYVQVSASPGLDQELYIQSCYASPSPDPSDKPEVSFIINRGCVASRKNLAKFVRRQRDRVNLVLGTSSLKSSQVYLHCRVSLSYVGLTPYTKFCNYNKLRSRWVDLRGDTTVCQCCARSCKNQSGPEDLLALTAIVSAGPLTIKEQRSKLRDYNTNSEEKWIMAGASHSGNSEQIMDNSSPLPVQPGFGGGVMVISQGLGGSLSMWLPELMALQLNPVLDGYPINPMPGDVSIKGDVPFAVKPESFEEWQMNQNPFEKSLQGVKVDDRKANFETFNPYDGAKDLGMWNLDVGNMYKIQGDQYVTDQNMLEPPKSWQEDFPSIDFSLMGTSPSPDKITDGVEDEGEAFFRQAEMVFKKGEDELAEPLHFSKLSLNQASDGSSSLQYEEQKRSSRKKHVKMSQQETEKDGDKREKSEEVYKIKDLISSLLDGLRGLWH